MLQAVIFDIDGTLVDSVDFHAEAWTKAFEKFGYSVTFEQMKQKIGKGGDYILEEVLSESDYETQGSAISDYRETYFQEHYLPQVEPFPQVRALMQRLREDDVQIALATSAEAELAQHYEEMLDVTDLVEGLTSAGDVDKAKPNPDVFKAALEKLQNVNPENVLVIGDSPYDAQAAKQIDLGTIGLLCGGFSEQELQEAGCIAVYQDIAELLANYDRSPFSR